MVKYNFTLALQGLEATYQIILVSMIYSEAKAMSLRALITSYTKELN